MKMKKLIYALTASVIFTSVLTACDKIDGDTNENITEQLDETHEFDDYLLYKMVYDEFKQTYSNITFDDFKKDVAVLDLGFEDLKKFTYESSYIIVNKTEDFWEIVSQRQSIFINGVEYVVCERNYGESRKTEYTYDENGNKLTETYSFFSFGKWITTSKYAYINGNKCLIYSEGLSGNSKFECTYDDEGNRLTETNFELINNEWVYDSKREYSYDSNGNELLTTHFKYIENEWVYDSKREYSYDSNGNELSTTLFKYIENEWVYDSKREYSYDSNGQLLTLIDSKYVENEWVKYHESKYIENKWINLLDIFFNEDGSFDSKRERTYDDYYNLVSTLFYVYEGNEWVYDEKSEYTYDSNGNELSTTHFKYIENEWVKYYESKCINGRWVSELVTKFNYDGSFDSKTECTYDSDGNKLSETISNFINNGWVYNNKKEYTYDELFWNKLTDSYSIFYHDEWVTIESSIYIGWYRLNTYYVEMENDSFVSKYESTYDENGNLLTKTYSVYADNAWVYNNKIEYTYDEDGNELSKTYYDYENNKWVLKK